MRYTPEVKRRKPRLHRVVVLLSDAPGDNEPYLSKKELVGEMEWVGYSTYGLRITIESMERAKLCERCGEVIPHDHTLSGKFCDNCFQEEVDLLLGRTTQGAKRRSRE
jgi:hypothetical protein